MKWLFLSDLQGVMYEDWYSFMNMDHSEWDVIVLLGDIDTLYLKSLSEKFHDKQMIGVVGNHDFKGDLEYYGIFNLHQQSIEVQNMIVIGMEGCLKYKNEKDAPLYTQEEASEILYQLPKGDIVVSHNSPYGIHDKPGIAHTGYVGLKHYIEKHQPKYVFHGHQHVHRITTYQSTKVIGIYGGWVWDQMNDTLVQVLEVTE